MYGLVPMMFFVVPWDFSFVVPVARAESCFERTSLRTVPKSATFVATVMSAPVVFVRSTFWVFTSR